ncbi:MAG TPA: prepilin-type N-terminal cleavage/methylation domain-containing protein, partial [Candidatus Omnitrophica bacterium]|nr:prepilin-type N-terminal cleavage/methylation domain-containing protein [Candidatus Omnitrophota bacterium]
MKKGFSLIELMIAVLIFSILLGATYSILSMSRASFQTGDIQLAVQQEVRKAMDKVAREIREASSVNLSTAYPFTIWGEKIKYEVADNQLLREVEGQSPSVLANNVSGIEFTLFGGDIVYITLVSQKTTVFGRSLSATLK